MPIDRIFIAAPLFNEQERAFNRAIRDILIKYMTVYLPQEDGGLLTTLIGGGIPLDVAERRIFHTDIQALDQSDTILAVLDGASIDEGVAFEIGYAFAKQKRCLGLQTDIRRCFPTGNNLMIQRALSRILSSLQDLEEWARGQTT